jgi:hypothetical protein
MLTLCVILCSHCLYQRQLVLHLEVATELRNMTSRRNGVLYKQPQMQPFVAICCSNATSDAL